MTAFRGTDSSGRIAPADIKVQVEGIEKEILHFLRDTRPDTDNWYATVNSIKRIGSELVIHSSYGSHHYALLIFDPLAIKVAEQLVEGDKIVFSGNLGAELSTTLWGGLSSPEFNLYPTQVSSKRGEIRQTQNAINEKFSQNMASLALKAKQEAIEEDRRQKQREEDDLENQVIGFCKDSLRNQLKYPASASFSWFKGRVIRKSENQWSFSDVVEAKNNFGGELPIRFVCDVTRIEDKANVSIQLLDGTD